MTVGIPGAALLAQLPPPLPTTRVDDVVARAQLTNYVSILGLGIERQLITAESVVDGVLSGRPDMPHGGLSGSRRGGGALPVGVRSFRHHSGLHCSCTVDGSWSCLLRLQPQHYAESPIHLS